MAAKNKDIEIKIEEDEADDETANLKPRADEEKKSSPLIKASSPINHPTVPPSGASLTRRMSEKVIGEIDRRGTTFGGSDAVLQYVPDKIANHIPGLNRQKSKLRATYFCNICFTKYPIEEGFRLTNCHHLFCTECIKGFFTNKIKDGVVKLKCFYPPEFDNEGPCSQPISEDDIHAVVTNETFEKYEKFKANLENSLSRQCPYCDHTQIGDPEHPMMACENAECGKQFCLYHNNAHPVDESCESYDLRTAKENKMNEMAIHKMGDDVKPCPQCKFQIFKNGGCNHMNCVKCGCSFCWLCMEIIEDTELPNHYKDDASGCKGRQFEGMDIEPPPKWVICTIYCCVALFFIPAAILGAVFGVLCYPISLCCGCKNESTGEKQTICQTITGCWLIWIIVLIAIVVLIPLIIIYCVYEILCATWDLFRICCPCLPQCRIGNCLHDEDDINHNAQQQQFERVANDENEANDDEDIVDNKNDENVAINVNEVIGNDVPHPDPSKIDNGAK